MTAAEGSNPIEAVRARLDGGRRWLQGSIRSGERECLIGACMGARVDYSERKVLTDVVEEQYPDRLGGLNERGYELHPLASFNDHPDTTWPDVDAMLDKGARRWDEQVDK